ncbi:hypothetical protein Rxycam_01732 [Rubrobacter xylanophilus DSM 9941]|uniref:hypothetical protein n=1 Tax=Rubrobacter xylanophilus TaxID=49319 RepID=UPI001C63F379|nr:hypothetical protein [Rubrobacter xylanophilus]QYJ15903.1 hypothetical protein Rxycam_01732 [Rubrobacter xylanophilus DSM 9941]
MIDWIELREQERRRRWRRELLDRMAFEPETFEEESESEKERASSSADEGRREERGQRR